MQYFVTFNLNFVSKVNFSNTNKVRIQFVMADGTRSFGCFQRFKITLETACLLHWLHLGIKCDSRQDLPKLLETKEMCLEYLLLLYTINPAPQQSKIEQKKKRNSLNQLLKKANIQSKTLRCQLRLSYTIHFDACQADNSRQNAQSRECRSLFMEVQLLVTQKKELIITISFLANLLVGSFYMSK